MSDNQELLRTSARPGLGSSDATTSQTASVSPFSSPFDNLRSSDAASLNSTGLPISSLTIGASLQAEDEGSRPIWDRLVDIPTKFVPLTGAAIFNSFANTAVDAGNFFGADWHRFTIEDQFGPDSATTKYYQANAGVIEGTALAVGSLAPGLAGIKVLKLAQTGKFGSSFQTATGLFSGVRAGVLAEADAAALGNATGASLFGQVQGQTIKALAAGFGDNALQGAAYEIASLATMHANPIYDSNSLLDNVKDVATAAVTFGAFGGIIDGAKAYAQIRKGVMATDIQTKAFEKVGAAGIGDLTPGDRIVSLYDTLGNLPEATSRLEKMKRQGTENVTQRLIRQQFIEAATVAGEKDPEAIAEAMHMFVDTGIKKGILPAEELVNSIGALKKVGRYDGVAVTSMSDDVFFITPKIGENDISLATTDELFTRTVPTKAADQKYYTLTDTRFSPSIARASDNLYIPSSHPGQNSFIPISKFQDAADAFKQGNDLYIDATGKVHINESSKAIRQVPAPGQSRILSPEEQAFYQENGKLPPGSAPLEGVGTTLDLHTGTFYRDSAPPAVVGDLGKPKLASPSTLDVGNRTFTHTLGAAFDVATATPLEANSRYVWAALRGIKNNDIPHSTDLPWIEQAFRSLSKDPAALSKLGSETFSDGIAIPKTADGMLQLLASKKQDLYIDMLEAGKNADEIGRVLNAPMKGITKNFNTLVPEELMFPVETSTGIRHVRLAYDIGTIKNEEGNLLFGMQGMQYRMKVASDTNTNTVSNYIGQVLSKSELGSEFGDRYLSSLKLDSDATGANILGSGNGFFRNANADYGTFGARTERAGKAVQEFIQIQRKQLSDALLPSVNRLRATPAAAAEYGNMKAVAHSSGEHWAAYPTEQLAEWGLPRNTLLLEGSVTKNKDTGKLVWNPDYVPNGFSRGTILADGQTTAEHGPRLTSNSSTGVNLQTIYTLSDITADLLKAHQGVVNERNAFRSDWWNSQGLSKPTFPPERVYFPPINTSNYPYFAYVTQRDGYALGQSGSSIITAKSAEELQKKIAALGPEYDAFTKGDIAAFKKAHGEYQWDRNFATNQVKTEMARKGILNNIVPETRANNLIDDLVSWHFRQSDMLTRDMVELYNAPTFAQLTAMGDRWAQTGTARFGAVTPFVEKSAKNPYNSYIRTTLGLGAKDDYPIWQLAQDKLQSYGDTAFNAVRSAFGAAKKGLLPWEEAAKVSERFGLGNPYGTALDELSKSNYYGGLTNQLPESRLLSKYVGVSNTTLGATTVRLDAFQQLIDATTFPIISALEYLPATKQLQALMNVSVPGSATEAPGFTRVMYNAIRNFWKDDGTLKNLYTHAAGLTRDELVTYRQMIDDLTLPLGPLSKDGWTQKIEGAVSKAETLVGTKFTNRFLHFVAADIGRQMGEAAGQSGRELFDTIGTFTNRVLGTSAANQRAAVFTGPVGQALGLFQSFNWNVMQQLLRHVGEGDAKAIAVAAGMQSTIFGVSTLPGFAQLNKLIAERHGNETGEDTFSGLTGLLGKKTADYLLYGSLSSLLGTSFYDRGDLNPRRLTVLPVNPLEFPSVSAGIRVYQNLAQLGNNLTQGAGSPIASVMLAAEHNGLSRPLSGLVQLAQGFSTDTSGRLVSANSGLNDMYNISNLSRLLGAKPLDEAIAGDALRRIQAMQVKDTARLSDLGRATMTSLYGGGELSSGQMDQLLADYARAGGNQDNFNSWFLGKVKNANVPVANQVMNNFNNPRSQMLMKLLGGVPLPSVLPPSSIVGQAGTGGDNSAVE